MIMRSIRLSVLSALASVIVPATAYAHVGAGSPSGFTYGFLHPIGGLDHVLAMVAVGILAANLGGRALWAVPATFVAVMAFGGFLGVQQIGLPFVEIGIALSVVMFGLLVALRINWPVSAAMALVAIFAVFHGHAHGTEMPLETSGTAYAAGFMIATALLHVTGILAGFALQKADSLYWHRTAQVSGSMMAIAGAGLLTGVL
jgi:urease accessory protein